MLDAFGINIREVVLKRWWPAVKKNLSDISFYGRMRLPSSFEEYTNSSHEASYSSTKSGYAATRRNMSTVTTCYHLSAKAEFIAGKYQTMVEKRKASSCVWYSQFHESFNYESRMSLNEGRGEPNDHNQLQANGAHDQIWMQFDERDNPKQLEFDVVQMQSENNGAEGDVRRLFESELVPNFSHIQKVTIRRET